MELWRRVAFVLCIMGAIWLAYLVELRPVVTLITVERQDVTTGRLITVKGEGWIRFIQDTTAASLGRTDNWLKHISPDEKDFSPKYLFFSPEELPDSNINNALNESDNEVIITADRELYLKVRYREYKDSDFSFGSGFVPYPDPPSYLLYPYRKFSIWLALMGTLFYLLYPRPKTNDQTVYYPQWRVVAGDIVTLLLTVPFFALPILVCAGSMQALYEGWPLAIIFWPFCLFGVILIRASAWHASYRLLVKPEGIVLSTYKGTREYLFRDMAYTQPLVIKPPRWLVVLSFLAVLSGKGSGAGGAIILANTKYGCLSICMNNGRTLIVNLTDQLGSIAVKQSDLLFKALIAAGVHEVKEVRTIESIGLTTLELDAGEPSAPRPTCPVEPIRTTTPDKPVAGASCKCGFNSASDALFCKNCGSPIEKPAPVQAPAQEAAFCTNCGKPLGQDARFCAECGSPV